MTKRTLILFFLMFVKQVSAEILVTAPHAHCLSKKERGCDMLAARAATKLAKRLQTPFLFLSTHYRQDTDLNREESRVTQFRTDLKEALKKCRKSRLNCLLIDVHSFPSESFKDIKDVKESKIPDVYFLHGYYDNGLANYLHNYLNTHNIVADIFAGSYKNDIMLEATYYLIPSVIIEFNESLSSERLTAVVNVIAKGITQYVKGLPGEEEEKMAGIKYMTSVISLFTLGFLIILALCFTF